MRPHCGISTVTTGSRITPIVTNELRYRDEIASALDVTRCDVAHHTILRNLKCGDFARKCIFVDLAPAAALCVIRRGTPLRARIGDQSDAV